MQWTLAVVLSGAGGAPDRRGVAAHQRRVLHRTITLAFAQMLYYLGISITAWGADDGMRLARRSQFRRRCSISANPYVFYYVVLAILAALLWLGHRLINARFGVVIRASQLQRAAHAGHRLLDRSATVLAAFALAGSVCGLAGALLTNQTEYLTPSFMHWTRSRRDHDDGDPRRHRHAVRPRARRHRALVARKTSSRAWTVHWQVDARADPRPRRPLCQGRTVESAARRCAPRWLTRCSRCADSPSVSAACVASDDIALQVAEGETLAIIGPNGAGRRR